VGGLRHGGGFGSHPALKDGIDVGSDVFVEVGWHARASISRRRSRLWLRRLFGSRRRFFLPDSFLFGKKRVEKIVERIDGSVVSFFAMIFGGSSLAAVRFGLNFCLLGANQAIESVIEIVFLASGLAGLDSDGSGLFRLRFGIFYRRVICLLALLFGSLG